MKKKIKLPRAPLPTQVEVVFKVKTKVLHRKRKHKKAENFHA